MKAPAQVFSCEFCKVFKSTFFITYLQMSGSKTIKHSYISMAYMFLKSLIDAWKINRDE